MLRTSVVASALFFVLSTAGCGGRQPEAKAPDTTQAGTPSPSTAATETSPTGAPAKPWKAMAIGEKKMHMKTVVMPKMTSLFQSFDAKKFDNVTCVTCHGKGAKNGQFVMPNPDLPKLSAANGFKKHMDKDPAMTKFMMEKVVGAMAGTLGVPAYDPATHQGFGCGGCHTME